MKLRRVHIRSYPNMHFEAIISDNGFSIIGNSAGSWDVEEPNIGNWSEKRVRQRVNKAIKEYYDFLMDFPGNIMQRTL